MPLGLDRAAVERRCGDGARADGTYGSAAPVASPPQVRHVFDLHLYDWEACYSKRRLDSKRILRKNGP